MVISVITELPYLIYNLREWCKLCIPLIWTPNQTFIFCVCESASFCHLTLKIHRNITNTQSPAPFPGWALHPLGRTQSPCSHGWSYRKRFYLDKWIDLSTQWQPRGLLGAGLCLLWLALDSPLCHLLSWGLSTAMQGQIGTLDLLL